MFTDEELEQWRDDLTNNREYPYGTAVVQLLEMIERLKAAEGCVKVMQECSECNSWNPSIDAIKTWKEASGKH